MIESIDIKGVATYGSTSEQMDPLAKLNFVYGANGSGKTTLSRIIADETQFPTCQVKWKGGNKLQPLVYNHDYIERNFNQSPTFKGVFTLGGNVQILEQVEKAKNELDGLIKKIEEINTTLKGVNNEGGKEKELKVLEVDIKEKIWTQKTYFDAKKAQDAFKGFMGSKDAFKQKVLQEKNSNQSPLLTELELEQKASSIFGPAPTTEQSIVSIDIDKLIAHEANPILKKRIIGKEDVDIAGMIHKLGNSDWVREGKGFYELNNGVCPFCQQETLDGFTHSLNEYFDQTYLAETKAGLSP